MPDFRSVTTCVAAAVLASMGTVQPVGEQQATGSESGRTVAVSDTAAAMTTIDSIGSAIRRVRSLAPLPIEAANRGRKDSRMEADENQVSVGVGAILASKGEVLLMRRAQPHGQGSWSTPGGYLEPGESFADCARREAREETGLALEDPEFLAVTNDVFDDGRHFLTVWMVGRTRRGRRADLKPNEEVAEFGWFRPDDLPSPLFTPFENLVRGRSHPPRGLNDWLASPASR